MDDPNLNRTLGPYRLDHVVGRGGMGTVYEATEVATGEKAAIKVLSPTLAADESFRDRFAAEIESLKKLQHPNIVRLFGFGEQDGHLFYVMELVEGNSLQEELRQGRRFTWREVSRIAIEVCAALKHAHDHGIIHRDLKPANLLLTTDDQIKLFDFGIAKLFGATQLTTGSVMGTADYMAPEQGEGKPVDPRTDLYSLGSVMYALLVGKPPFSGKSIAEVVHKVRFDAPIPVCRLVDDVPVELEQLIDQLLEKQPERRVPTALAVNHRLKAMEHALSVHPPAGEDEATRDTDEIGVAANPEAEGISDRPTIQLPGTDTNSLAEVHVTTDGSSAAAESHFTRVDATNTVHTPRIPWAAVGSLVALVIVGASLLWAFDRWRQPPTADDLYQQIIAAKNSDNDRWMVEVENEVDQFLTLFGDDARHNEVAEIKESIELDRLQRRLNLQARRGASSDSPLEQLYLAAIRKSDTDLATAVLELQAILDLHVHDEQLSEQDQQRLRLAQRQIDVLQLRLDRDSQAHLQLIDSRLQRASDLSNSQPEDARRIYQGVINLYGRQPWARAPVERARAALTQLP